MLAAIFAVLELFKTRFCYSGGKGTVKCHGFRWLWVTVIQERVPYSMLCASYGAIEQILFAFCPSCGSSNLRNIHGKDMDELLRYYFQKEFSYKNMLLFLSKYHDTEMCMRTLQQRLHEMGLKRRNVLYNIQEVRREIINNLNGPGCSGGNQSLALPQVEGYSSATKGG